MTPPIAVEASAPVKARRTFIAALVGGDLDSAVACFARDGCLVTPDATSVHGRDRIRPVLAQLIACRIEIGVERHGEIVAGGVTLARERWRIRTGAASARMEQCFDSTLVFREVEGRWKLALAAPWGWGRGWA